MEREAPKYDLQEFQEERREKIERSSILGDTESEFSRTDKR